MVKSLKKFSQDEVARERLKIIKFYNTHGEATTKEAFGVGRKTVYVWKKRLKGSKGKLKLDEVEEVVEIDRRNLKDFDIAFGHREILEEFFGLR